MNESIKEKMEYFLISLAYIGSYVYLWVIISKYDISWIGTIFLNGVFIISPIISVAIALNTIKKKTENITSQMLNQFTESLTGEKVK